MPADTRRDNRKTRIISSGENCAQTGEENIVGRWDVSMLNLCRKHHSTTAASRQSFSLISVIHLSTQRFLMYIITTEATGLMPLQQRR